MANYPTPHIDAKPEDFAKTVLMPGDPLRAKFIAETFLKNAELINNVRGIQGYTGSYNGEKILKVIIETCLLTEQEKIQMCKIVGAAGADFIKTSTGFSSGGATREDIALMAANVPAGLKIKAAGGIRSLQDAEDFLKLGASRLGTSAIVKIIKEGEKDGQLSNTAY